MKKHIDVIIGLSPNPELTTLADNVAQRPAHMWDSLDLLPSALPINLHTVGPDDGANVVSLVFDGKYRPVSLGDRPNRMYGQIIGPVNRTTQNLGVLALVDSKISGSGKSKEMKELPILFPFDRAQARDRYGLIRIAGLVLDRATGESYESVVREARGMLPFLKPW